MVVACGLGVGLGVTVGTFVGVAVGATVGVGDGVTVGATVGVGDGVTVGATVGGSVWVGVGSGATVGSGVGAGSGVDVGADEVWHAAARPAKRSTTGIKDLRDMRLPRAGMAARLAATFDVSGDASSAT